MKHLSPPWTSVVCELVLCLLLAVSAAGQLAINPVTVSFGSVPIGISASQSVILSNTGNSSLTISQTAVQGTGFTVSGLATPLTLAVGQAVSSTVTFAPQSGGTANGSFSLTYLVSKTRTHGKRMSTSSGAAMVPLSGTAMTSAFLAANPGGLSFVNVPVGSSQTQSATLTNSGNSNLTISQATITGGGFTLSGIAVPLTLATGQSVSFSVLFAPRSAGGASGNLVFTSNASDSTMNFPLSGTAVMPGQLIANPNALAFGSAQIGSSLVMTDALTNTGGTSVTVSQATSTQAAFSISGLNLPLTLSPGASVTFSVLFTPQSAANTNGNLTIGSNASDPTLTVALSGSGTTQGQLAITPAALSFGNVTVGSKASQSSNLSASGASVTVSSANLSSSEYSLSGISFPLTIAAGQSISFTVNFAPQVIGAVNAALSFVSDASNALSDSLSGDGISPPQHSVSLSWTDSGSGVVGYNVYRGGASGGPYTKINSALEGTVTYTDSSVAAGQTYYYVTTAVEGNGSESAYSNEAQAVVPSP